MNSFQKRVAIIGSGPAGLMAADVIASGGHAVHLFEKRPSAGRKLLIAGASGLNVSYDADPAVFHTYYRRGGSHFERIFRRFPPYAWLDFLHRLGIGTFKGTSRRIFVDGMKATPLLSAWVDRLKKMGCVFSYEYEFVDWNRKQNRLAADFTNGASFECDAICLCLGGASHEPDETPLRWPAIFERRGIKLTPFEASNVGFEIDWPARFLAEAEGKPLKGVSLRTRLGEKLGELVITRYGIEGSLIYAIGVEGAASLDLKPELSHDALLAKLSYSRENLSPIRRVSHQLKLGPAARALIFHLASPAEKADLAALARRLKSFPILLKQRRPLAEAISSSGGVQLDQLNAALMFKEHPGIFAAGEMLDWDAPTGGFLIQGCVAEGNVAGHGIVAYVAETASISPSNKA